MPYISDPFARVGMNLHKAVADGYLRDVPKELLTEENLLRCHGVKGRTVIHYAAEYGYLGLIPREILAGAMSLRDVDGLTVLHLAADWKFRGVPAELLTPFNLSAKDNKGITPLHMVRDNEYLDVLLGLDIGDSVVVREIVGENWWERNQAVLRDKAKVTDPEAFVGVDLF